MNDVDESSRSSSVTATSGRRARNRAARHQQLIDAASAIVAEKGLDDLTMQEVADRVDCAVGTIYTYFSSKSALLAALQSTAIRVLADSHEQAATQWDAFLESGSPERAALDRGDTDGPDTARPETADLAPDVITLARIVALSRLFAAWPDLQPREFDFLQMLIASHEQVISVEDAMAIAPQALVLFTEARVLIAAAVESDALRHDPDRPGDDDLSRTVRWISGLDGAVMVAAAAALVADLDPDAFDRRHIAENITADLLSAWGADPDQLHVAFEVVDHMEAAGELLPESR